MAMEIEILFWVFNIFRDTVNIFRKKQVIIHIYQVGSIVGVGDVTIGYFWKLRSWIGAYGTCRSGDLFTQRPPARRWKTLSHWRTMRITGQDHIYSQFLQYFSGHMHTLWHHCAYF